MSGYIRIYRQIWDHPAFRPSKFSQREAFIWMVCEAAWKPKQVRAGDAVVTIERGQLCHSLRFLAEKWGWKKDTVKRFLDGLKTATVIETANATASATGQLVITICNYDKFQGERDSDATACATANATRTATAARQQRDKEEEGKKERSNNPPNPPRGFDEFWDACPRKVGKGAARKAYAKALKLTDAAALLSGMRRYSQAVRGKDPQYIAHPSTWLNQERWADDVSPQQSNVVCMGAFGTGEIIR